MPEMDFGSVESVDQLGDTATRVLAYMTYPDDPVMRTQGLAASGASIIGNLEARKEEFLELGKALNLPSGFSVEKYWVSCMAESKEHNFSVHDGGYRAVAMGSGLPGFSNDAERAERDWMICGNLFLTIKVLHDFHQDDLRLGASIGKAISYLEEFTRLNRDQLDKAWTGKKKVATLCAALLVLNTTIDSDGWEIENPSGIFPILFCTHELLALAKGLEHFATTFKSHGRQIPLVDPSDLWMVPRNLDIHPAAIGLKPLEDEQLTWLKDRKARARY